jgi:hypothetical protein
MRPGHRLLSSRPVTRPDAHRSSRLSRYNLIRPQALTRKNSLFAGHDEGATNWACIASLIATCKMNGVEPFAYLRTTLERLAAGHACARLDELLPWRFEAAAGDVAG